MSTRHTVGQGECLASIAALHGFGDPKRVYQHGDNAALRKLRPNPDTLLPGDVVAIPDKDDFEGVDCGTGRRHDFVLKREPTHLRVRLRDRDQKPMAAKRYTLTIVDTIATSAFDADVAGLELSGTTDGDGLVEKEIPPNARGCELKLFGEDPEIPEEIFALQLGHLDPIDAVTGAQMRLRNLGFYRGEASGTLDDATVLALRVFQDRSRLEVTGELDHATRARLAKEHAH